MFSKPTASWPLFCVSGGCTALALLFSDMTNRMCQAPATADVTTAGEPAAPKERPVWCYLLLLADLLRVVINVPIVSSFPSLWVTLFGNAYT
jgi:hypothetical protein